MFVQDATYGNSTPVNWLRKYSHLHKAQRDSITLRSQCFEFNTTVNTHYASVTNLFSEVVGYSAYNIGYEETLLVVSCLPLCTPGCVYV